MSKVICLLKSVAVAVGHDNAEVDDDDSDTGDDDDQVRKGLIEIGPEDLQFEIRTLRVGI